MNKLEFVKNGVSMIVSLGTGAIVGNAIKHVTPTNLKLLNKVCIGAASIVMTGVASDVASKYTEGTLDKAIEAFRSLSRGSNPVS